MRIFVLAFAFGIWLLQQQPALPDGSRLAGLVAGALVLLFLGRRCEKSAVTLRRPIGSAMLAGAAAEVSFRPHTDHAFVFVGNERRSPVGRFRTPPAVGATNSSPVSRYWLPS